MHNLSSNVTLHSRYEHQITQPSREPEGTSKQQFSLRHHCALVHYVPKLKHPCTKQLVLVSHKHTQKQTHSPKISKELWWLETITQAWSFFKHSVFLMIHLTPIKLVTGAHILPASLQAKPFFTFCSWSKLGSYTKFLTHFGVRRNTGINITAQHDTHT